MQIIVLGYNYVTKKFKVLKRESIHRTMTGEKNIQTMALDKIIELDEKFKSKFIYVDKGFGSTQTEILEKYYFMKSEPHKIKAIDFNSNYSRKNILTGETDTKRMKGMLVYFLQKRFEYKEIEISKNEEVGDKNLTAQLDNYIIDHYDSKDNPVFAAGSKNGDHILDALMLANFAFIENFDTILNFNDVLSISAKPSELSIEKFNRMEIEPIKTMSTAKTSFLNIYNENNFTPHNDETEITSKKQLRGSIFNGNKGFVKRKSIF